MKNSKTNLVAIFATAFLLAMFSSLGGANAQETFEVSIATLDDPLTTCPTITSDERPLDEGDIVISVENLDTRADTYDLKFELPSGWSGFPTTFYNTFIT